MKFWGKDALHNQIHNQMENEATTDEKEEIKSATKIKIIAALLVIGFATYIAYWVQEPSQLHTSVLSENTGFTQEVSIVNFAFNPATVTVEKGTTIVWTNKDPVAHTVTSANFSSGKLNAGETFSYTFNEDGQFEYSCSFHPQMKGMVLAGQEANTTTKIPKATTTAIQESATGLTQELATTPNEGLSPAAVKSATLKPAAIAPSTLETEVIFPQDASTVTLDAQALLSETTPAVSETTPAVSETTPAVSETTPQVLATDLNLSQQTAILNAAVADQTSKLAASGPEDLLYVALLGFILYCNRRRFTGTNRRFTRTR